VRPGEDVDGPGPSVPADDDELLAGLVGVRDAVAEVRLPLAVAGADAARREARTILAELDDYLLPRVRQRGAPLLAVVGGSTGAGKSTLVNTLVGAAVSPAGVLRPTTRSPVLVHHPDDEPWFAGDRVLPGLARWRAGGTGGTGAEGVSDSRSDGAGADGAVPVGDARSLRLVAHPAVPHGLALLDAPDIDSVVEENRELGAQLLAAADVWVFVTTAARYADAVPWDLLARAAARRAAVAVVLDRLGEHERDAVERHLARMLAERGLPDAVLLTVPEARPVDGLLPAAAASRVRAWLETASGDAARDRLVQASLAGAVADLAARLPALAAASDAQPAHADRLRAAVAAAYDEAAVTVRRVTSDGTLLRGEVLARWQEFVGTGELLRALEQRIGAWRDRLTAALRGRRGPEPVTEAIGSGVVDVLVDAADTALAAAQASWRADPAGRVLVGGRHRSSADLRERAAAEVRAWQAGVLDLVATEGADRRVTARVLSFGVNGLGAALMVAIFAHTGGLTTAEVGVAGGTAVLAQRLLEAVFGDDAVRRLTRVAAEDLDARLVSLLDEEAERASTPLDALDVTSAGPRLRRALAALPVPSAPPVAAPQAAPEPDRPVGEAGSRVRAWWRRLWET
jgi:energy-coupling factor transporter ATP-binding protein EcfA2